MENNKENKQIDKPKEGLSIAGLEAFVKKATAESGTARTKREDKGLSLAEMEKWVEEQQKMADEKAKRKAEEEAIFGPLNRQIEQGINKLAQTSAEREAFFEDLDRKMYEQDKAKLSNKPKNGIESAIAAMPISTDAKVQKKWESIKDEHDFQGWRENNILQYQARQAEEIAEVLGVVYPERGVGSLYAVAANVLGKGHHYEGKDADMLNSHAELIKELGLWEQGMTREDFFARQAELSKEFDKYRPQGPVKIESDFPAKRDLKWYETMMSEQALKDVSPLIKEHMSDDGTVLLGGKSVDANALAYAMANERMADIHNYLMAVDERYYNLIFEKKYGKTFEQYVNDAMAEEFEKLLTRYKQLAKDYKKKKVDSASNKFEAGLNSMGVPKLLQKPFVAEYEMELGWAIDSSLDDVIEDMEAAKASGNWSQFWKGADAGFDLYNTFTFGLNELVNAGSKNELYEKKRRIDNGASETWSYDEELLYELYKAEDRIRGLANDLDYKKSGLAKLGEGLGTTAEIMPQFALGMTTTGGIGAGVKYKAGQAAKRYMANKTIANAAGVAYHGTIDLGKWAGVNYVRGMAAAPMMPMFYKGVLDEYNSQYHFEGDELVYTPKNKTSMWAGAYIDTVNEIASEHFGAGFGDVVGLGLRGAGRMLGINKMANKSVTGVATRRFLQSPMKESTKKLLKDMGYSGNLTGEWTGEMFGDLMSQWQRYMVGADYDFEHFKDFDTWLTTIGVSAIMGGTMTTLGGGMTIYQETKMAKDIAQNRERIINNKIQDADLRDKLRMLSEVDDPMMAASELATFFQTHHIENASDKAYALDYIMLNSQLKVLMGDVQEQERMVKFEAKRAEIEGKAYHGADGKSTRNVVIVRDAEGNAYYVLRGDMANKEAMLELMDANTGEMTTKVASAVMEPVSASVDSLLINAYGNMFSLEEEVSRVKDVTGALSSVENPTMEHVETTAMQLDITLPKKGDVVTMVDGRTAEITEDLGDGTYIAQRKASLTGESETITLPFDAIRSNDSLTAKAQETILNNGVESAVDATSTPQATAEVQTPVESTTPQPTTQTPSGVSVGAVIVAPNGEQARVVEINDDGTVTLNYNLNEGASMADAAIEVVRMEDLTKADGSDASANVPTTAQTEMPQPAVPQPAAETPTTDAVDAAQNVEVVPTQQDGTVDFDAIEDPAQCAQLMAAMLGGPENALAIVEESIEAVKAEMDKAVKAKAPTINEGVAKQNKINEIKARLIRYEQIAFELEQMMKPAEAKSEVKAENMEHEAGLVENEHTAGLPEGMRKSIDEMAKRAKVRIEFVNERIKGDAEQRGNLIRVSTRNRTKAVEVLVGHEMLHFMKSKMPEAYKAFKEAVIAFMGKDKFAKDVARRKKAYAAQNVKLNDEDAAEEIVADYAGYLVQGRDVFEKFIEPKKSDNVFLRGLKKGLEYIRNIFGANGMTKQVKAVDNMVDALNTLINATVEGKDIEKREETTAETTKNEEVKGEDGNTNYSLKGDVKYALSEETTKIFDAAKAKFGTTYDMREAGYILPDGSMLDFSGRHQVEGDASFLNGDRTVDHRDISDIAYDAEDNETGIKTDLGDFLDRGAIRIDSNAGAINLNVAPTKAQKDRLKRLIERNDGYVYIDFGKGWDTEHYAEYEAARASRVLGDIDRYFDEGIKPAGNVKFSLQETNDRFNAELATLTEENKDKINLSLGMPSDILLAAGVVNKPMKLYGAKLWAKSQKHGYKVSDLRDLPKNVAAPIAIFKGSTDGSHAVLTEIKVGENNVLATLSVGKGGEDIDFNIISSVYGKQSDNVVKWIDDGKLEYVDKEKALNYLHHSAPIAEALSNPRLISATNIIQNFENPKIEAKYSLSTAPTFYSNAEYAVRGIKQEKATPEQWLKMIEKNGGLKAGEDKWLGLSDWLKASDKKTLTKDEVLQYIAENDIQIEEVSYGDVADISREEIYESAEFAELREGLTEYDEDDNPYINRERYDELRSESYDFVDGFSLDYWGEELEVNSPAAAATYLGLTKADREINSTRLDYTTKGLANKREIALVVPTIEPYNQSDETHFGDAGDGRAVAWVRFGEATDADGKRVLVIDEIQSKRHQDGREKGYISDEVLEAQRQYDYLYRKMYKEGLSEEEHNRYHYLGQFIKENYGIVPSAPFEKNWAELAFKRMLRYAAENGYDYVAWTTGDQQAERYNIGSTVSRIMSYAEGENTKVSIKLSNNEPLNLTVNHNGEVTDSNRDIEAKTLSDVVGKELATKILNGEGEDITVWDGKDIPAKEISGDGLRIGGEGMRGFYDQMLPSFVKKYTKKWGAEVKDITMPALEENNTMHAVNVTDSMRESVMQGQPKFSLPTDLLTDFSEEFNSLQKEYESLAPSTIDYKHPFRVRKREVVEQYAAHMIDVIGFDNELYVCDKQNDSHLKELYNKLRNNPKIAEVSEEEFVQYMKDENWDALNLNGTNVVIIDISNDAANEQRILGSYVVHENLHQLIKRMNIRNGELMQFLVEAKREYPEATQNVLDRYKEKPFSKQGEELLIANIQQFVRVKALDGALFKYLVGEISLEDILSKFKKRVPLREELVGKILKALKNEYSTSRTAREASAGRGERGEENPSGNIHGLWDKYTVPGRGSILTDTRYSLSDIPFFDAEGNAIDMSAISEAKAHEMIDGRVRDMMVYDYDKSVIDITNQAKKDRRATRAYYAEERRKRRGGNEAPRTNAAKIDEIFADANINSLPLEVQALIFIAEGRAKIRWADKDGKRGLASELGLTNSAGDKAAMKNIWSGAEQSFDEVVHGWWESINGYERGIDTQDLRNALIDALMSFPSAKAAMRELQSQYDTIATAEREALEEIDRREAADLERVKREYEERSARFEVSEGEEREAMREMAVEHYSSQPMSAADEALEELTDKLNKMERKAERLMLEQKSGYRELAESIEKSKEIIIRTLEHLRMFSGMEQIHIDEVAKLIAMTRTARSKRQVEAVATKAKNLIQRIAIRKARENMRRLLDLKLSNVEVIQQILKESNTLPREERDALLKSLWKVSRNGWRATKAVHPDTKEIFKELNDLIKEYKKSVKDKEVATIKQTITDRLASLEAELHPDVEVDDKGNVIDNAGLPTDFNDSNRNIALHLFKSYLEVEAKNAAYSEAIKTLRDTKKSSDDYGAAVANMYASRDAYLSAVKQFNATLEDVIVNGKDKLRDFNIEKEKHEVALRSMAINAIGGKKASAQGKRGNALQLARAGYNISVNAPYWTFETVLERIDRLSPYKKGEFYNYFMRKYTDANAKLYTSYTAHMESIGSAMARCFPDMAKQFGIIGRNPYEIYKAVMRKAEATDLGTLKYMEGDVEREMQLTVANAMYIVAMWRQPRYREAMEANGITEVAINNLMQSINKEHAGYINFMDWVNTALLPNTRLEYDEVYRKLNGGSLAKEENYFPARVVTHEDVKLDENGKGQLPSSPTALKERISHKTMPKMGTDYFKVLEAHIQDMDKWAAFAELTADLNVILSSDEFRRRLNEFMPGIGGDGGGKGSLYKMLYDTALIATGNYHNSGENVFGLIQKTWATSNIAFRLWTAVKQISSVSVGATERGYFIKHMLAASTVAGIAYEWQRAMALSPSLRYRWQSKAAGMEALMRETSRGDGYARYRGGVIKTYDALKDMADKAVKLGMTPNALVDAIACSILVNSVYDKAIHDMTKGEREATEEERKEAIRKAEIAFNSTQQSSEGAYLSAAQANPLYAPLTTYMNASFALHRKRMSGIHELWKLMTSKKYKRFLKDEYGVDAAKISAKDAFADIIRGIVGDLSFAAMGWGLMEVMSAVYEWLGGDGDDDDTEAEKQAFFETYWMPALNGFLGGGIATSIMQGFDTSMTPAYDELLGDIGGIFDDKGDWRGEVAQFATKYGLGIDLKSLYRIGAGLQNMVAEEDDENAGSILMFLNAPNKYIKAFVGDRREGETMEQYQTRIMRLYTLFDKVVYEELSDENGDYIGEDAPSMIMSQTQAEDLKKEYEPSRLKDVVVRYGGWDEYKAMMNTEMLYKDICEFIGVTPDAKPSKVKLRNTVYSTGEYVEPVDGLTEKEHDNLLDGQGDIYEAHYYRTRWIGDDEGYYELLSEEYKRKNGLIEKYNEYIK